MKTTSYKFTLSVLSILLMSLSFSSAYARHDHLRLILANDTNADIILKSKELKGKQIVSPSNTIKPGENTETAVEVKYEPGENYHMHIYEKFQINAIKLNGKPIICNYGARYKYKIGRLETYIDADNRAALPLCKKYTLKSVVNSRTIIFTVLKQKNKNTPNSGRKFWELL